MASSVTSHQSLTEADKLYGQLYDLLYLSSAIIVAGYTYFGALRRGLLQKIVTIDWNFGGLGDTPNSAISGQKCHMVEEITLDETSRVQVIRMNAAKLGEDALLTPFATNHRISHNFCARRSRNPLGGAKSASFVVW